MKVLGMKLLKGDLFIIAMIMLLATGILIGMIPNHESQTILEIYVDGKCIESIPLDKDRKQTISMNEVIHNTIEIDGEQVRITESTCYDHICERRGTINKAGEVIVCMPNKLLLKIVGDESMNEYDAVTG